MRRILAIAILTVRHAVRSRGFAALLALLLLCLFGIPRTITGDGTLRGYVTVLLNYTLGFAVVLLATATAWSGCAAAATEIADRRIHLLAVKPVHRWQIWLGHWLGIVALDAAILAVVGLAAWGCLRWAVRPARLTPAERRLAADDIFTARRVVPPVLGLDDERLRRFVAELRRRGEFPAELPPAQALAAVRARLATEALTVPAGHMRRWVFRVPPNLRQAPELTLRWRYASAHENDAGHLRLTWIAGPPDATNRTSCTVTGYPNLAQETRLPGSALAPDGTLTLDVVNADTQAPQAIVFYADDGLELLIPAGGFAANCLRALLVVWCFLALLAALGETAGCVFSLPVAAFLVLAAMIVMAFSHYIATVVSTGIFFVPHDRPMPTPTTLDRLTLALFDGLDFFVRPLTGFDPLGLLAQGRVVPWAAVGRAFLFFVVTGGGAVFAVGALLFNRRELALPTE